MTYTVKIILEKININKFEAFIIMKKKSIATLIKINLRKQKKHLVRIFQIHQRVHHIIQVQNLSQVKQKIQQILILENILVQKMKNQVTTKVLIVIMKKVMLL